MESNKENKDWEDKHEGDNVKDAEDEPKTTKA